MLDVVSVISNRINELPRGDAQPGTYVVRRVRLTGRLSYGSAYSGVTWPPTKRVNDLKCARLF
jgi:hypothetical protein